MELVRPRNSTKGEQAFQPNAFVVLSLFLEHISMGMEEERAHMDRRVCARESKTGVAVHNINAQQRAKITEYVVMKKDLHMLEGLLAIFEHMLAFQAELAAFLSDEHIKFCQLRRQSASQAKNPPEDASQIGCIQASLRINASMAKWRLEQVRVLSKRVQIQLKVVSSYSTYVNMIL